MAQNNNLETHSPIPIFNTSDQPPVLNTQVNADFIDIINLHTDAGSDDETPNAYLHAHNPQFRPQSPILLPGLNSFTWSKYSKV